MERENIKDCSLDELISIYEEVSLYVKNLTKELEELSKGEENA